jgi:hypothetical protein
MKKAAYVYEDLYCVCLGMKSVFNLYSYLGEVETEEISYLPDNAGLAFRCMLIIQSIIYINRYFC